MANVQIRRSDFGNDFIFGSATSAYQIEGSAIDGGKGLSIWDTFSLNTPAYIEDGSNANVTAHQYNAFKEDVKLMKRTGLDAYRFSISWSRILPGGKLCTGVNNGGIKYYNDLIDAILAEGMKPYATLFHWDLPLALELEYGGFLSKRIVDDFCDFAELCFWEFGDRVKYWITINEAWTYAFKGYVNGTFPPARGSPVPRDIEKHALATVAESRDMFTLLDLGGNWQDQFPFLSSVLPSREEIQEYVKDILPSVVDSVSLEDIDKIVKDLLPSVIQELPFVGKIIEYIKDVVIGLYVDYKNSKRAEPCLHGDAGREPYIVGHNFILAHSAAVDLYRKKFQAHQGGKIGMTNNANYYLPYDPKNEEDKKAAARALDFMFYWFVAPLVTGDYPPSMRERVKERLPVFTEEEVKLVRGSYDFLGVNYYTTYYAIYTPKTPKTPPHYNLDQELISTPFRNGKPIGPRAGSDWLYIYPEGIHGLLVDIKKNYQNPLIYITENGVDERTNKKQTVCEARVDQMRMDYHRDHLLQMKKAKDEDGVNVKAYFIWSFADNYEWAEGYCVRFGIFYVDFLNGRLSRHPKDSAIWWMNFLSKNIVSISAKRIRDMDVDSDPPKKTRFGKA